MVLPTAARSETFSTWPLFLPSLIESENWPYKEKIFKKNLRRTISQSVSGKIFPTPGRELFIKSVIIYF